jgi:DNA-binding LacI/PurR family transcriptional regulator
METVVRHVRARGYRRIGLALHHGHDGRSNHAWAGAFLALQQFWPSEQQVPVMALTGLLPAKIAEWVKKYRLDAVISHDSVAVVLEALGYRIPQDIGFATFMGSSDSGSSHWAGIDENARQTGAAVVDLLVGMIHRGERGIPKVPQYLLVDASWREGKTLRPQRGLQGSPPG